MRPTTLISLICLGLVGCAGNPLDGQADQPASSGQVYTTQDGRLRFVLPEPWTVALDTPQDLVLRNYTLSAGEEAQRIEGEFWGQGDGEGQIGVTIGDIVDLEAVRGEECREEFSTLRIHECTWLEVNGIRAAWVLADYDGDCTCRVMVLNGSDAGYRFSGGGCLGCSNTPEILREVEVIFRSVEVR